MADCSQKNIELAFAMIVEAALKNERCPKDQPEGSIPRAAVGAMIALGMIDSLVSCHNYRTVVILVGEHAGRTTLSDGAPVWKKNGKRIAVVPAIVRQRGPSAPRLLTDPRNSGATPRGSSG